MPAAAAHLKKNRAPVALFTRPAVYGQAIALEPPPAPEPTTEGGEMVQPLVWNQIGRIGAWKGHAAGAFELRLEDLDQIVGNFRRHPWYLAGPDGLGMREVIPFDFHHASERPAEVLARDGAPAQAWALELQVRAETAANVPGLYALTRYIPPMDSYAREGRYKSCSMVIWPHAHDPITDDDIGWYLSSIAFTNDPFIQGMEPIAATRWASANDNGGGLRIAAHRYSGPKETAPAVSLAYYVEPDGPVDVVCQLRDLFGLSTTAELGEVLAELSKLRTFATSPEMTPPGVDVPGLLGRLRRMLNLPTLADTATVFAEVDTLLARLASAAPAAPTSLERKESPSMKLQSALIGRLALAAAATEDQVLDATSRQLDAGSKAQTLVTELLAGLGVEDPAAAFKKIADQAAAVGRLEAVLPELEELRTAKASAEKEGEEKEVEEVMATRKLPDAARAALLSFRRTDAKAFRVAYPPLSAEQRALLQNVSGGGSVEGAAAGGATRALGSGGHGGAGSGGEKIEASGELAKLREEVEAQEGDCLVTKCRNHVLAKNAKLGFDEAHRKGVELSRKLAKPLHTFTASVGV